jgi:microcystin-dependent protein
MSTPYLGQIEAFPFNVVPKGWVACQGQLLSIAQNSTLFSLLGTTYGGNGIQTFALPNLQGVVAMGQGTGAGLTSRVIGERTGEQTHTILITETPTHNHQLMTAPTGAPGNNQDTPTNSVVLGAATGVLGGNPTPVQPYASASPPPGVTMASAAIGTTSGSQAHPNVMPYLVLQFCIATSGIFPSRA